MAVQVFINNHGITLLILAIDPPKVANDLVALHFFPSESDAAAFFEQTFTLIRAVYDFKRAHNIDMSIDFAPLHHISTLVFTLHLSLRALVPHMVLHVVERQHETAV